MNAFSMKIIQWNCFKMTQSRLVEFKIFLDSFKPDIVSIQEIKMNQEEANFFLRFDGYVVYYKSRDKNPEFGGGSAIIVENSIAHVAIEGLDKGLDHVGIKVEANDVCFNLVSLYAPSNTLKADTIELKSILSSV